MAAGKHGQNRNLSTPALAPGSAVPACPGERGEDAKRVKVLINQSHCCFFSLQQAIFHFHSVGAMFSHEEGAVPVLWYGRWEEEGEGQAAGKYRRGRKEFKLQERWHRNNRVSAGCDHWEPGKFGKGVTWCGCPERQELGWVIPSTSTLPVRH